MSREDEQHVRYRLFLAQKVTLCKMNRSNHVRMFAVSIWVISQHKQANRSGM